MNLELVADDPLVVARWVASRIPLLDGWIASGHWPFGDVMDGMPLPFRAIGLKADGVLQVGAVYDNWRPFIPEIEITLAVQEDRPLCLEAAKMAWRAILAYPFLDLGCRRLTARTAVSNDRCLAMLTTMGFRLEGLLRHGAGTEDAAMWGLYRDEALRRLGAQ